MNKNIQVVRASSGRWHRVQQHERVEGEPSAPPPPLACPIDDTDLTAHACLHSRKHLPRAFGLTVYAASRYMCAGLRCVS